MNKQIEQVSSSVGTLRRKEPNSLEAMNAIGSLRTLTDYGKELKKIGASIEVQAFKQKKAIEEMHASTGYATIDKDSILAQMLTADQKTRQSHLDWTVNIGLVKGEAPKRIGVTKYTQSEMFNKHTDE